MDLTNIDEFDEKSYSEHEKMLSQKLKINVE
jgi:hypothetical protein